MYISVLTPNTQRR